MSERHIVMVGMMGSGKSAIGRGVAARLGLPFFDADAEIEATNGCTISEIFARQGEAAFRHQERCVMGRLLEGTPCVLATGGGGFIDEVTRKKIRQCGISVWLQASVDLLLKRVAKHGPDKHNARPLLKSDDWHQTLARLATERNPVYAQADITIQCANISKDRMVARVCAALEDFSRNCVGAHPGPDKRKRTNCET